MMLPIPTLSLALTIPMAQAFSLLDLSKNDRTLSQAAMMKSNQVDESKSNDAFKGSISRRNILVDLPLASISTTVALTTLPQVANAIPEGKKVTGAEDGNLPDLPPEAARSYLQYRIPLQVAIDYYLFELKPKLSNIDDWGEVNQLFQTNNNRGQGQPNKIERDYTNTMRILLLSFPPDESESMRSSQFKFERAMQKITKTTSGIRRDLPIEIDSSAVKIAEEGWEEGRIALNEFLAVLNEATGLNEMKLIPDSGPDQNKRYGRSARKYFELTKKTKLCQNRGGPALSQAWGQLMISGYLQENMDSCGSKYWQFFTSCLIYT
jgi:hypothetical protein